MASRQVDIPTIKKLFSESRGHCAICDKDLFPNGVLIGEICHIEAYSSGGSRFNSLLTKKGKENHYDNLIILCPNCHTEIDKKVNENNFNKEKLIACKVNHLTKTLSNPKTEIDERQIEQIIARFEQSILSELLEIKTILNDITENDCFSLMSEAFKSEKTWIPSLAKINSFYFSKKDIAIIERIKKGIELEVPQSYILIGPPTSGKTTLMLKITSELTDSITHFYINLSKYDSLQSVKKDLKYLKKINAFIYVDDCHLNNNLACDIYNLCFDSPNLTLVFIYREISDELKVSDIDGLNLFKIVSQKFYIDAFANQEDKIKVLIENKTKKIFESNGIEPKIGNIETIYGFIDKNLLKLSLLLEEWEEQPTLILDSIDTTALNKLLYRRFLNSKYNPNEIDWLKTYASINKFEIPFRIFDKTNLKDQLLKDALVNKIETEYSFFHSSFANLILLSIISIDDNFDLKYPRGIKAFEEYSIKKYLVDLANINIYKYADKIVFILHSILVNKNFDLYKFLIRDNEVKNLIVQYFKFTDNYEEISMFFKDIATSCSNKYHTYYTEIIDKCRLDKMLSIKPESIIELKILLFILKDKSYQDFKKSIKNISTGKIKRMLLSSRLNDITYTIRYIYEFDREFSKYLIDDILIDDWVLLFNQSSVSTISESSIELQQIINKEFVKNILLKIDIKSIFKNSDRDQIERFTQAIQSLNKINEVVSKKIADSVSEHFISQRIINQPLDKISKCLQDLYIYKGDELQSIVKQLDDDDIINELGEFSLAKIGKTLSELSDINKNKISNVAVNEKLQLVLLEKLSDEQTLGIIGKVIADLKKVEPNSANSFVSNLTSEKINNLIYNSSIEQLATFIYNLFSIDEYRNIAVNLYLSISTDLLASKVIDEKLKITNLANCISTLAKVKLEKTIEIFSSINDNLLFSKCINIQPRKVLQSLKALYFINPKKIKKLTEKFIKDSRLQQNLSTLSKTDLIHLYGLYLFIDKEKAKTELNDCIENIKLEQLEGQDISAFSDGLKLVNDNLDISINNPLIKKFELYLIKTYSQFRCNQISITFINLRFIDRQFAYDLINKLSIVILAEKAIEIDGTNKLNGFLGEIKVVNPEYCLKLTTEIQKRRKQQL